jgi:hypothetical protein
LRNVRFFISPSESSLCLHEAFVDPVKTLVDAVKARAVMNETLLDLSGADLNIFNVVFHAAWLPRMTRTCSRIRLYGSSAMTITLLEKS